MSEVQKAVRSTSQDREGSHDFGIYPGAIGVCVCPYRVVQVDSVKGCNYDGEEELERTECGAGVDAGKARDMPVLICHGGRNHSAF